MLKGWVQWSIVLYTLIKLETKQSEKYFVTILKTTKKTGSDPTDLARPEEYFSGPMEFGFEKYFWLHLKIL